MNRKKQTTSQKWIPQACTAPSGHFRSPQVVDYQTSSRLFQPLRGGYTPTIAHKKTIMKIKSNIASLLAGIVLGAVAILSIAATSTDPSAPGRFQLLSVDRFIFRIDTATGQVWRTFIDGPSREFMQPVIGAPAETSSHPAVPNIEKNSGK